MSFNQGYNDKMAALLAALGIPTDNVMADPGCAVHPGGVVLSPRFFLSYKDLTPEQREALVAITGPQDFR